MGDTISCQELKTSLSSYYVVDVREQDEYQAGHISNAASIPLGKLIRDEKKGIVPKEKDIVVHCKSGVRGAIAQQFLKEKGYQVRNLEGGYDAYCSVN